MSDQDEQNNDGDNNNNNNNENNERDERRAENQAILKGVLDSYRHTVEVQRQSKSRHLVLFLPECLKLDTHILNLLKRNISELREMDRPSELVFQSSKSLLTSREPLDEEALATMNLTEEELEMAHLVADIIGLSEATLKKLCFPPFPPFVEPIQPETLLLSPKILWFARHRIRNLEALSTGHFQFGNDIVQIFLSGACKIRVLEINDFDTDSASIARILHRYEGLQELALGSSTSISGEILNAIQSSPSELRKLRLIVGNPQDGEIATANIVGILQSKTKLVTLELHSCFWLELERFEENQHMFAEFAGFVASIAQHPSLENLRLRGCTATTHTLSSLLNAAVENPRLREIDLSDNSIRIDQEWVDCLPKLTGLQRLVAFGRLSQPLTTPLTHLPEWASVVLPALHQNTSLIYLDSGTDETLDFNTARILARNRMLHNIAQYKDGDEVPVWPLVVERLAAKSVEASALYVFLRRTAQLPDSSFQRHFKRLLLENAELKKENKKLKCSVNAEQTNEGEDE